MTFPCFINHCDKEEQVQVAILKIAPHKKKLFHLYIQAVLIYENWVWHYLLSTTFIWELKVIWFTGFCTEVHYL